MNREDVIKAINAIVDELNHEGKPEHPETDDMYQRGVYDGITLAIRTINKHLSMMLNTEQDTDHLADISRLVSHIREELVDNGWTKRDIQEALEYLE